MARAAPLRPDRERGAHVGSAQAQRDATDDLPSGLGFWYERLKGVTLGIPPEVIALDDQSGNGNHLAQAFIGPDQVADGFDFNGTNAYMTAADAASLDPTTGFTLVMRVKPDVLTGTRCWASKSTNAATGAWYVQWASELRFGFSPTIAGNAPSGSFTAGAWHTCVMVYDGGGTGNTGRCKWWINGVSQTNTYYGTVPSSMTVDTNQLSLGAFNNGVQYFDGKIAFVCGANVVASGTQVTDITAYADSFT